MPIELTNDELIDVPLANLQPGELRRTFMVQAMEAEKKQDAVSVQHTLTALQGRKQEEEAEHDHRELVRREEVLLTQLQERQREIVEEAEQLDRRTIKLDDGRRAYVDHDKYRDGEGRELSGADRAQAELHHLDKPDAATWQEHEDIERRLRATKQLREKVEALQAHDDVPDASKALTAYEKSFKSEVAANQQPKESAPDYGSADYMGAYGLSDGFKQAATGTSSSPSYLPPSEQPVPRKANALVL